MAIVAVTDLMLNFAEACRALVPALDRAGVPWRDGEQYDTWDRVAEPLFQSLVMEPCVFHAVGEANLGKLRMARYGLAPAQTINAWVAVQGSPKARVISLSSVTAPFSHVHCEELTDSVPLEGSRFIFGYDVGDGAKYLETVDLTTA